jgi:hypothetical protein
VVHSGANDINIFRVFSKYVSMKTYPQHYELNQKRGSVTKLFIIAMHFKLTTVVINNRKIREH